MLDLAPTLSSILVERHSNAPLRQHPLRLSQLDAFLQEAYQINRSITSLLTYLRAIRRPYLSTAPPPRRNQKTAVLNGSYVPGFGEIPVYLTDAQREHIDSETSTVLRDVNNQISNLTSAINIRHDTDTQILEKKYGRPTGLLWRWAGGDGDDEDSGKSMEQLAAEGAIKTSKQFRDGVIWYLNYRLRRAVDAQQGMIEVRLERERDRGLSMLRDERNKDVQSSSFPVHEEATGPDLRARDSYDPALGDGYGYGGGPTAMPELTAEQLQLFQTENNSLLNHYTDQLAKVTQAEKSLVEISSLQSTLIGHLNVQGEMIGNLVSDAEGTTENVQRGNRELKKANERGSTARLVFWGTAGLCSFLVIWDLIF